LSSKPLAEAMMRAFVLVPLLAVALIAAAPPLLAQGTGGPTGDQPGPKPGTPGNPIDPATGKAVEVHDQAEAPSQPSTATGLDLNGPPQKFAPSQTPE
jgi:hypothetical protein